MISKDSSNRSSNKNIVISIININNNITFLPIEFTVTILNNTTYNIISITIIIMANITSTIIIITITTTITSTTTIMPVGDIMVVEVIETITINTITTTMLQNTANQGPSVHGTTNTKLPCKMHEMAMPITKPFIWPVPPREGWWNILGKTTLTHS